MDREVNRMVDREEIHFLIQQTKILVQRLERISADSIWAHRASGHRGAILKWLDKHGDEKMEQRINEDNFDQIINSLKHMIEASFALLVKAAQEYPENIDQSAQAE